MTAIRTDIQALRGIAVLAVVAYHLQLLPLPGGYLGVDIFYVISGYLITLLVITGLARGDFRLRDFYTRRAKRLLPAAYVTIAACALVAPWLLSQQELRDFAKQVVGALTFTANLVLWRQSGYFEGASDLKPLLHTWSLSIEEQYYLLLPGTLMLLKPSRWALAIGAGLLLSLALCVVGSRLWPQATFYWLPTRAWELLLGSAGALLVHRHPTALPPRLRAALRALLWPCLALMVFVLARPIGGPHPGADALVVCLCTLVVILRRHAGLENALPTRGLALVGDISYSLYLVHWPIVAFMRNAWVGPDKDFPLSIRLGAFVAALITAVLLYHFVENPVRRARWRFTPLRVTSVALVSVALMSIAPLAYVLTRSSVDYEALRESNVGLDRSCVYTGAYDAKPQCQTSSAPRVLVWGDSFAMHLVSGLSSQAEVGGLVQATRSVCGPLVDVAPVERRGSVGGPVYDRAWAAQCLDFNRGVVEHAISTPSIEIVVLSSPLVQYEAQGNWINVRREGDRVNELEPTIESTAEAFRRTAAYLRAGGKKVVFIAPPPTAGFNIGACLERLQTGRLYFGAHERCEIPVAGYRIWRGKVIELVDAIERAGIPVIRLAPYLCDSGRCKTMIDQVMVYNDEAHLSIAGSRLLAERMGWGQLISKAAR